MTNHIPKLAIAAVLACLAFSGCQTTGHAQRSSDAMNARLSFLSWNIRSAVSTPEEADWSEALAIASLKPDELAELMETQPAPNPRSLSGAWLGINKGIGPALAGITQDIKVFENCGCCVRGHNVSIHQVPIDQLDCRGWQPEIDSETCQPVTMGNFIARSGDCCGDPLQLDYTIADNKWNDPSKILIDDLVFLDRNLLLGRAYAKIGMIRIPVAYFVLYRPACESCHSCSYQSRCGCEAIGNCGCAGSTSTLATNNSNCCDCP